MPPLADTATWIAVGFAVGAAVLALTASLVLLALVLRRTGSDGISAGPDAETAPEVLEDALEDARAETERSRRLAEIATSIDLDAVLERTLAAAASTDGIDAAMAVVRQTEETPIIATFGMSAEEAARQPVSTSPSGGARAVRISYRFGAGGPEHRRRPHPRRCRRPSPGGAHRDDRDAGGLLARRRPGARGRGGRRPRDSGPDERARDQERPGVPRGTAARRYRRAHRPAQPPLLPRDPRARKRPGPALRARAGADHPRHRRLQGDGTTGSATWRATTCSRPSPNGCTGPCGNLTLPAAWAATSSRSCSRRPGRGTPSSSTGVSSSRSARGPPARPSGCASPRGSPSSGPRTTPSRSSSVPTTPSTAPRKAARARCSRRRAQPGGWALEPGSG